MQSRTLNTHQREEKKPYAKKNALEQKLHSVENEMKFIAKIAITYVARIEDEISLVKNKNKNKTLKCKSSCLYINKKTFDEEKKNRSSSFDSKLFMLLLNRCFFPHTD